MNYAEIPINRCGRTAVLPPQPTDATASLGLHARATTVMTDFAREYPLTVRPDRSIDDALAEMVRAGVRALLVARDAQLLGLITSYDIQGERPIRFLQSADFLQDKGRRSDVRVGDVMTPANDLPVLFLTKVKNARIGDLAETFRRVDATHLLVVDDCGASEAPLVRGLVSRTRLQRHLGDIPDTRTHHLAVTT